MRIDKYLWCIRVFKTRSMATTACRNDRVVVGEAAVKPSREVEVGNVITVRIGAVRFTYKVLDIPKNRVGAKLVENYSKDLTDPLELEKLEMIRQANRDMPRNRLGRPTKKDRRDIDKLLGDSDD